MSVVDLDASTPTWGIGLTSGPTYVDPGAPVDGVGVGMEVAVVVDPPVSQPNPEPPPDGDHRPIYQPGPIVPPPPYQPQQLTEPIRVRRWVPSTTRPPLDGYGRPTRPWAFTEESGDLGYWQLLIGGRDVTYWRGAPTQIISYSTAEPFSFSTAVLRFEQTTGYEAHDMAHDMERVEIRIRPMNGGRARTIWAGWVVSVEDVMPESGETYVELECVGLLYRLDNLIRRPDVVPPPAQDLGDALREALTPPRRLGPAWPAPDRVHTGLVVRQHGRGEPMLTGYVRDLLARGYTLDGTTQWTVDLDASGRKPVIKRKDRSTVHWRVWAGQPGVDIRLTRDNTGRANVTYGQGVTSDGGRWRNTKFPHASPGDVPAFPGWTVTPGTTAPGVGAWKRLVRDRLGTVWVDHSDTYHASETLILRHVQYHLGLAQTEVIDATTWEAVAQRSELDLTGAHLLPVYVAPGVSSEIYDSTGRLVGGNPAFDPTKPRREEWIDFGRPVGLWDAVEAARRRALVTGAETHKDQWVGTITLRADPHGGSRWDIRAGQNILLVGHRNESKLLHIVRAEHRPSDGVTALEVDSSARDIQMLTEVRRRQRDALGPEARRPSWASRRSRHLDDTPTVFDAEGGAGVLRPTTLDRRRWSVQRVPFAASGRIVRTVLSLSVPAWFAVGIFDRPITEAELMSKRGWAGVPYGDPRYGDPTDPTIGYWSNWGETDGLVIAWGGEGLSMGYTPRPGSGWSPDQGRVLTGYGEDNAAWDFRSTQPPTLWVAIWADLPGAHAVIEGRFYGAPVE